MTRIAHYDHDNLNLKSSAIEKLIGDFHGMNLVYRTSSIQSIISFCQQNPPDILLITSARVEESTKKSLHLFATLKEKANFILLTNQVSNWMIPNLAKFGIIGYLVMATEPFNFKQCVQYVIGGRSYCCPEVSSAMLGMNEKNTVEFSNREREILRLVVDDLSSKEIAQRLSISVHTVDYHRKAILRKFNAKGTAGMVRKAIEGGYV